MGEAIPKEVKDIWDRWNIRSLVILSLALQTILVLLSPNRKRTHRRFFRLLIWSAYLLANWAAEYAVGQISDNQGSEPQPKNTDLLAFWATFLLLHLGGPDTITALAIEDNDLWLRSLFALVCQAMVTFYVFMLSIPNNLLVPTSLMLVAGVIKYVERIKALRGASLETFKDSMLGDPDPGPDYARLMEEYSVRKMLREPTQIIRIEEAERGQRPKALVRPPNELTDLEAVQYAYKYFNIFKGLVVDLMFSSQSEQLNNSKEFFNSLRPNEALRVLEVELSFIYGTFYTKVNILHTWIGISFRFMALASLVSSLCIFAMAKKSDYNKFDVDLTYVLLIGGIGLDLVAIFIFCVSDWTFARFKKPKEDDNGKGRLVRVVFNWILSFRELKWESYDCSHRVKGSKSKCEVLDRKFVFRRWSEYIYSYNLIGYSMGLKSSRIHNTDGYIHRFFDAFIQSLCIDSAISCTMRGIGFCFRSMKHETDRARSWLNELIFQSSTDNRKLYYALYPLKLFLRFWFGIPVIYYVLDFFGISDQLNRVIYTSSDRITKQMWEFIFEEVRRRSKAADRAENASDIYSTRGEWVLHDTFNEALRVKLLRYVTQADYDQSILMWHIATELLYQTEEATEKNQCNREFSKILSDYMMYLLFVQPALMSTVAGIDKTSFMEAIAEVKKSGEAKMFLKRKNREDKDLEKVCDEILSSLGASRERRGRRHQRRNVLADASRLANALKQLSGETKWDIMSKVWVEMLCYGATYCDPKQHVAQLCKGGEFISFVWLLMAHFGLGDQFQTTEENARARLIVAK
ncbi:hypothetical protein ISN45_At05g040490 [Arabidopsis thaliana x Arabidopsis arenosa]|uniref:DUF4220 domain-containing protein n=3 Tax=Arabidopsis TaxID=3701 RepID=A0A178UDE9_ARATH|nr:hypothetical protein ISN45_At05g040490 [Arabidopsis thaliana x Arabidopsis arenosa]OAO91669.1 hypothetical protein AXX17_AT5G43750 [Arabidopsis thaliana]